MPGQSPAGQAPTRGLGLSGLRRSEPCSRGFGNARAIACRAGSYEGLGASPAFRRSEPCSRGFGECPGNRLQGRLLRGAWGFPVFVGASPAREILSCRSLSSLRSPLMGFPDLPLVLSPFTFHLSPFTFHLSPQKTLMPISMTEFAEAVVGHVRTVYGPDGFVPLHRPVFAGTERADLVACIDSNFVSSVGEKVTEMERRVAEFAGAGFGVAVVNGTNALQVALRLVGVARG